MKARKYRIEVEQGSDYKRSIPVIEPADPTGWTVSGQIRPSRSPDAELLHTLDVAISGNYVILYIPGVESSAWNWLQAVYDVELYSPEGAKGRFLQGDVVVDPEVTRG